MFRWRSQLECGCVHEVVIHEWVDRKVRELPPDPEEPEHGLAPMTWAKICHPEPHSSAFWTVKLWCGAPEAHSAAAHRAPADGEAVRDGRS